MILRHVPQPQLQKRYQVHLMCVVHNILHTTYIHHDSQYRIATNKW